MARFVHLDAAMLWDEERELEQDEASFCHLLTGLEPGELLDGKYRIEGVLGVGGMGVVLGAMHLDLERPVAIKVLRAELAHEQRIVTRLLQEGRAAARIKSEHVAQVIDVGRLSSGAPYVVMERLEGVGFDRLLLERGRLPLADAVDAIVETCEALAQAHAAGIVHRDLKPGNLFLARRGDGSHVVKLLDFGISKTLDSGRRKSMVLTDPHLALGSPSYMAPEQIKAADEVDARADIWALGAILFELLTGRQAFDAHELTALQARILLEEHPALRAHRPDVPAEVERVIRRCMMKDREARYPDVEALARDLVPFGSERASAALERSTRWVATTCRTEPSVAPPSGDFASVVPKTGHATALGRAAGWASVAAAVAFVIAFFGLSLGSPASATAERALLSECQPGLRALAGDPEQPEPEQPEPDSEPAEDARQDAPPPPRAPRPALGSAPPEPAEARRAAVIERRPPWARYRRNTYVFRPTEP